MNRDLNLYDTKRIYFQIVDDGTAIFLPSSNFHADYGLSSKCAPAMYNLYTYILIRLIDGDITVSLAFTSLCCKQRQAT